jgi:hypothetical protein
MVRRFEVIPVDLLWPHLSAKRPTYFVRGIDVSNPAPSANESSSRSVPGCRRLSSVVDVGRIVTEDKPDRIFVMGVAISL